MTNTLLLLAIALPAAHVESISIMEIRKQQHVFQKLWQEDFVWKFDDLPTKGQVAKNRVPYSGYIYPDRQGGTSDVLRKYDRAYNRRGNYPAVNWEAADTTGYKKPVDGLLGVLGVRRTPDWHGHCNGWTAAAIRHAEPQRSVAANGVVFSPADIKALLAEIYMYNDTEMLSGLNQKMNPGTLHALLANWLGRESHPLGMEKDPGEEKWNYPVYAYASSFGKHSPREVEVNTNVVYAEDLDGEYDQSPHRKSVLFFHYMLRLNARGEIIGGYFFPDSSKIDMLWVPLHPKQGGEAGNEAGNPYVDVEKVLALWRRSASAELQQVWRNIDSPHQEAAEAIATRRSPATAPRPAPQPAPAQPEWFVTVPATEPAAPSTAVAPAAPSTTAAASPVEAAKTEAADPKVAGEPVPRPVESSPQMPREVADDGTLRWLD